MDLSTALSVIFTSMSPILELRGAIPLGIALGMSPLQAFFWAVPGNIAIGLILLKVLDPVVKKIFTIPFLEKRGKKYFDKLHHQHSKKFEKISMIGLMLFVGIPLPGSGAWTGAFLGYLFGIPMKLAGPAIALGAIMAGIIVTFASDSIISLASAFF